MCEETPETIDDYGVEYRDWFDIKTYLRNRYGFKQAYYEATFHLD